MLSASVRSLTFSSRSSRAVRSVAAMLLKAEASSPSSSEELASTLTERSPARTARAADVSACTGSVILRANRKPARIASKSTIPFTETVSRTSRCTGASTVCSGAK